MVEENKQEEVGEYPTPKKRRKLNYINNPDFYAAMVNYSEAVKKAQEEDKDPPIIPDYIGKCFIHIATRLSTKSNFAGYCVDEKTEALTDRGWVDGHSLKESDLLLSMNSSGKYVWSNIRSIYRNEDYDGLMHKLKGKSIDALITPEHKFMTARGLIKVEHLLGNDRLLLTAKPAPDGETKFSDDFVEIVAWAITEGHYSIYEGKRKTSKKITLYQNTGPKADKIEYCLIRLGAKYKRYKGKKRCESFDVTGKIAEEIHDISPKKIPSLEFVLSLSQRQRELFIETVVNGDGYMMPSHGGKTGWFYYQKCKEQTDVIMMICTMAGRRVNRRLVVQKTPFGVCEINILYIHHPDKKNYCMVKSIDFHGGRPKYGSRSRAKDGKVGKETNPNYPTIPYQGLVWCPETDYGNFVCRRGRYVYITGNSYREEFVGDAIENCVKAIDHFNVDHPTKNPFAYFTQICWNAMIRRIKVEKLENAVKHKNFEKSFIIDAHSGEVENYDSTMSNKQSFSYDVIESFENSRTKKKKSPKKMIPVGIELFLNEEKNND